MVDDDESPSADVNFVRGHNDIEHSDDSEQEDNIERGTTVFDLKEALHNIIDSDKDESLNKIIGDETSQEGTTATPILSTTATTGEASQAISRRRNPKVSTNRSQA